MLSLRFRPDNAGPEPTCSGCHTFSPEISQSHDRAQPSPIKNIYSKEHGYETGEGYKRRFPPTMIYQISILEYLIIFLHIDLPLALL